jgi:hypothetical protein
MQCDFYSGSLNFEKNDIKILNRERGNLEDFLPGFNNIENF